MADDEMWRPGAEVDSATRASDVSLPGGAAGSSTAMFGGIGGGAASTGSGDESAGVTSGPVSLPAATTHVPERVRWRRRAAWSAAVAAAVVIGAVTLVGPSNRNDPLGRSVVASEAAESGAVDSSAPFAGADPRRLPDIATQQWSVVVPGVIGSQDASMLVDGRDVAIGAFRDAASSDAASPSTAFVALDATTGEERWRTPIESDVSAFSLLGVLDGVVVAERLDIDNRSVIGLSAETGEVLWERSTGDPGVHVVLEGTSMVTRVSFTVNARLTFIDPATGAEVGRVPGRLFATDFLGRWYVRNGSSVSEIDLSDGFEAPVEVAVLRNGDNGAATVVDGHVLSADGAVISLATEAGMSIPLNIGEPPDFVLPDVIRRFSPMIDSTFAFAGSGVVVGAELRDDIVIAIWQVDGGVVASSTTDRGLVFLVGAAGDAQRRLVDGSTGETIVSIDIADDPEFAGNGVIVRRDADLGVERVGLDLDGNERWSLLGDGPVAIGDRVLVSYGPADGGVNVIAFGDI